MRLPNGSLFLKMMCPEMTANLFFRQLALVYEIPLLPPSFLICPDKTGEESTCLANLKTMRVWGVLCFINTIFMG